MAVAPTLFPTQHAGARFPRTRYQGSKRKLLGWIGEQLAELQYETVLDAFGGTGSVSYMFKSLGKRVTYNDVLRSNHLTGTALIENNGVRLSDADVERVIRRDRTRQYDDFIERTFGGIYFTDEENRWLDAAVQNIPTVRNEYARAVAWYALLQACLAKRPYNLFHRKNLYMRTAAVKRSFGNKATWDRSFEEHFRQYVAEANDALLDTGQPCEAVNLDAAEVPGTFDLVYIDPPYVSQRNVGVDYLGFYHFLEGVTGYAHWPKRVDFASKHRRLLPVNNPWSRAETNLAAFRALLQRFADSILVLSYRSDGLPGVDDLVKLLGEFKRSVRIATLQRYQYALSTNRASTEVLLIGT